MKSEGKCGQRTPYSFSQSRRLKHTIILDLWTNTSFFEDYPPFNWLISDSDPCNEAAIGSCASNSSIRFLWACIFCTSTKMIPMLTCNMTNRNIPKPASNSPDVMCAIPFSSHATPEKQRLPHRTLPKRITCFAEDFSDDCVSVFLYWGICFMFNSSTHVCYSARHGVVFFIESFC